MATRLARRSSEVARSEPLANTRRDDIQDANLPPQQ
eukprot:CAMPEP_0196184672 /NCGR_PEP_ID=MMETSP0911-20130528/34391_1 /TAXON_ID=49265 /ORGANISM="Thalassiosira rotula, Strain GSO102" /LENGTH=35 /DNA_ID= /DNA_START= /DNA_END= /DNA_ORIENTATION=